MHISRPVTALALLTLLLASQAYSAEPKTVTVNGMTVSEKTAEAMRGGCEYNPYERLLQLGIKESNTVKIAPKWINGKPVGGIDPSLACRLSQLIEWAKSQGCSPRIDSAYRSEDDQRRACTQVCGNPNGCEKGCASPGGSCHQYGLAVDMPSTCQAKLKQEASRFQLRAGTSGYPNPVHFQCIEHTSASCSASTPSCKGGIAINGEPSSGAYSPSSALSNIVRQALGMNQQQQQPPPPTQQQPLQQAQQPSQYFPTSQPTTNTGTSNTGSQSPTSVLSPESQKYLGVTQPDAYAPSIADQLLELAYGTQVATTTSTSSIPLVIDPKDNASLALIAPSSTNTPSQSPGSSVGSLQPSQTFTSPDLNYASRAQQEFTPPQTGVFAVLENLKTILLRMLEILRPMGIRNAIQGEVHVDEYAE